MQAISDLTWLKHLMIGRVMEEITLGPYRAIALRLPDTAEQAQAQYHFRLLVFSGETTRPVLSFNLESSILGGYLLTGQVGGEHRTYGPGQEDMDYSAFRSWALGKAEEELRPLIF